MGDNGYATEKTLKKALNKVDSSETVGGDSGYATEKTLKKLVEKIGGGGGTWGSITGTISNQTDLQNSLDNKQNILTAGQNVDITNNTVSVDLSSKVDKPATATNDNIAVFDGNQNKIKDSSFKISDLVKKGDFVDSKRAVFIGYLTQNTTAQINQAFVNWAKFKEQNNDFMILENGRDIKLNKGDYKITITAYGAQEASTVVNLIEKGSGNPTTNVGAKTSSPFSSRAYIAGSDSSLIVHIFESDFGTQNTKTFQIINAGAVARSLVGGTAYELIQTNGKDASFGTIFEVEKFQPTIVINEASAGGGTSPEQVETIIQNYDQNVIAPREDSINDTKMNKVSAPFDEDELILSDANGDAKHSNYKLLNNIGDPNQFDPNNKVLTALGQIELLGLLPLAKIDGGNPQTLNQIAVFSADGKTVKSTGHKIATTIQEATDDNVWTGKIIGEAFDVLVNDRKLVNEDYVEQKSADVRFLYSRTFDTNAGQIQIPAASNEFEDLTEKIFGNIIPDAAGTTSRDINFFDYFEYDSVNKLLKMKSNIVNKYLRFKIQVTLSGAAGAGTEMQVVVARPGILNNTDIGNIVRAERSTRGTQVQALTFTAVEHEINTRLLKTADASDPFQTQGFKIGIFNLSNNNTITITRTQITIEAQN